MKRKRSTKSQTLLDQEKVGPPKGWQEVKLGDLLTPEQTKAVMGILNKSKVFGADRTVDEIDSYLAPFTKELLAKGVLTRFLAFVLVYQRAIGHI